MATYYTSDEHRRMADAISAHDRAVQLREACERLARLIVIAIAIFIPIALFYAASGVG